MATKRTQMMGRHRRNSLLAILLASIRGFRRLFEEHKIILYSHSNPVTRHLRGGRAGADGEVERQIKAASGKPSCGSSKHREEEAPIETPLMQNSNPNTDLRNLRRTQ
mmetsp:Transcript_35904/g.73784  ORF Transcript_35904/g.73784 Transcript_35904/m.73784 type:complete len:108 (+) Transcript_35904:705-1028(+)